MSVVAAFPVLVCVLVTHVPAPRRPNSRPCREMRRRPESHKFGARTSRYVPLQSVHPLVAETNEPNPSARRNLTMTLSDQIESLKTLDLDALRKRFLEVLGRPTNAKDRDSMIQKISEKLAFGHKPAKAGRPVSKPASAPETKPADEAKRAKAKRAPTTDEPSPFTVDPRLPAVGQSVEKEIRGKTRKVTVRENGLEYEGRLYRSLSSIAREILGCAANGFLTFGLVTRPATQPAAEKSASKKTKATTATRAAKSKKAK